MSSGKAIVLSIAPLLGFSRRKPTTPLGKYARNSERAVIIVAVLYFALTCFPQPLFAYNVSAKGVTIYSRAPLPPETTTRIEEALSLVSKSELAVPGRSERIFICDNPWLFRVFAPFNPNSFGISYPVSDNIFIVPTDLAQNASRSSAPEHNRRSFSTVAAHEITHGLIRHRLGLIRGILLASWVNEGYSDYIARESSFPEEQGFRNLLEGKEDPSTSFRYFVDREMVRHLIEDRHYSFDDVAKRAGDADAVKAETIAALKEGPRK
jgi:hypothetical protein